MSAAAWLTRHLSVLFVLLSSQLVAYPAAGDPRQQHMQHVPQQLPAAEAPTVGARSSLGIDAAQCGRGYEGIGALLNSDAPWLTAYPPKQLSEILDILFLPKWGANMQVLKLEVGGDGHSTINTESSHMHTERDEPSFKRGWILPLLREATRRNPSLKVGGLAWSWPNWTKDSVEKKVRYLTAWAEGLRNEYNVTLDFIGLQNEGEITGGPANFSVALRQSLDAAGFGATLIECCDAHDWKDLEPLFEHHDSAYFHAVDALAVHEPLRSAESVPVAATATGKRIWSSESWQSYANSDGGGCWARVVSWGYVKGNVTRHMAWNAIQSYPSVGNGVVYDGHGLMWAEVPWSGHYWVNSPVWITAHYTQATAPGWKFLPVGSGSGMLPSGGSYVSLVSSGTCRAGSTVGSELTIVLQTMSYDLSKCFKDTHLPFTVESQVVSFKVAPDLLAKLPRSHGNGQDNGSVSLFVRRTQLFQNNTDNPYWSVGQSQRTNRYFEALPAVAISETGEFSFALGVDEVVTLSTVQMSRGDDSLVNDGLPLVPNATDWPEQVCANLTGHSVDAPMVSAVIAVDQQGVWEARPSRDPALHGMTTMQQVVPAEPDEWHAGGNLGWPRSFIGPAANLSVLATLRVSVLPPGFESGWAGIGIGGQTTRPKSGELRPDNATLAIWANGSWCCLGNCGTAPRASANHWFELSVTLTPGVAPDQQVLSASIDGVRVAHGVIRGAKANPYANPYVAASYSTESGNNCTRTASPAPLTAQSNAEFRDLCLNINAQLPKRPSEPHRPRPHPPGPPPPPPPPSPMPVGPGLALTVCDAPPRPDPSRLWTFSGEDKGESGTLRPSSNATVCLDASVRISPVYLRPCVTGKLSQQWRYDSDSGQLASVQKLPPVHGPKATNMSRCLDSPFHNKIGVVGFFDCKTGDLNQRWVYDPHAGASLFRSQSQGTCLVINSRY